MKFQIKEYLDNDLGTHDIVISNGVVSETIYAEDGESKNNVWRRAVIACDEWNELLGL